MEGDTPKKWEGEGKEREGKALFTEILRALGGILLTTTVQSLKSCHREG